MIVYCFLFLVVVINSLRPYRLRVEYNEYPIGLDVDNPRFFWAIDGEGIRGDFQTSYQLKIYDTETKQLIADTQKINSSLSSHIRINNFSVLNNTQSRYCYTVQIWNGSDIQSNVATAYFISSPIAASEWDKASWLTIPSLLNPNKLNGLIMNQFRTEFDINATATSRTIRSAYCYFASPNYYVAFINNIRSDDHILGAFTQFDYTTYYDMADCTSMLKMNARNVIGITLGNGRYTQQKVGAPIIKIIIKITFMDNSQLQINSNSQQWLQGYGPIRMNDIYRGEWYDATKETKGWLLPYYRYDSDVWRRAQVIASPVIGKLLSAAIMPAIKKRDSFTAKSITNPLPNVYVFDFGQNVAGICEFHIAGNEFVASNITMVHSEQLNVDGTVAQLYGEQNEIATYTLRGDGNAEIYIPSFTYFGYQYVEMRIPANINFVPSKQTLTSYFIHTAFDVIGNIEFGSSSTSTSTNAKLLNTIESMTRYSSMSNYVDIPTDCPQRERYGYLGDAQLTSDTVLYHWDIAASYTKFIADIGDTQKSVNNTHGYDGYTNALPDASPYFFHGGGQFPGDISWTAAYIILVHQMYVFYGDTKLIHTHYEGMKQLFSYIDSVRDPKTNLLPVNTNVSRYGDWCAVPIATNSNYKLRTDGSCPYNSAMLNTYTFATESLYLSEFARIVGNDEDAEYFYNKFVTSKQAIYDNFWKAEKGYFEDNNGNVPRNQTTPFSTLQALGLDLGVLTAKRDIESCVAAMAYDINVNQDGHIYEGIVGLKYILKTLCEYGECASALNTILQKGYPSYQYWIENGATTLWEEWPSSRYDNRGGSKNHIMFGTQSAFYFQYVAGIRQAKDSINWKSIVIDPFANCTLFDIHMIAASVNTLIGSVSINLNMYSNGTGNVWQTLNVDIPSGSVAMLYFRPLAAFPDDQYIGLNKWIIVESDIVIWQNMTFIHNVDDGIINGTVQQNSLLFTISSGKYFFKLITSQ